MLEDIIVKLDKVYQHIGDLKYSQNTDKAYQLVGNAQHRIQVCTPNKFIEFERDYDNTMTVEAIAGSLQGLLSYMTSNFDQLNSVELGIADIMNLLYNASETLLDN